MCINLRPLINGRQFGSRWYKLLRVRHIGVCKVPCATPHTESGAEKLHETNKYEMKGRYSPVICSRVILVNGHID